VIEHRRIGDARVQVGGFKLTGSSWMKLGVFAAALQAITP